MELIFNPFRPDSVFEYLKNLNHFLMHCGPSGMHFWHFYDFENFWGFLGPKILKNYTHILQTDKIWNYKKKERNYPQRKVRYKAKCKFCFMSITADAGSERANPCGEFRWSPKGQVSQIHSPHLHAGASGIFSDLLRCGKMLKREWSAESNEKLPHLFIPSKTAT